MLSSHPGQDDSGCKYRHRNSVDEKRCRFIGEVDLPESKRDDCILNPRPQLIVCQDLEPLLVESTRRFVLFPIQYPDVSRFVLCAPWASHKAQIDMADV